MSSNLYALNNANRALWPHGGTIAEFNAARRANLSNQTQPQFGNRYTDAILDEVCLNSGHSHNGKDHPKFGNSLFDQTYWPAPGWAPTEHPSLRMMGYGANTALQPSSQQQQLATRGQQVQHSNPFMPQKMNYGGGATEVDTNPSWTGRAGSGDPDAPSWNG